MLTRKYVAGKGHRGNRKVKFEIIQALVMINLYVKFNVYSNYAKQVIVLKLADRSRDGRHLPKFWPRPKNAYSKRNIYSSLYK